jgi:hypothetical protein
MCHISFYHWSMKCCTLLPLVDDVSYKFLPLVDEMLYIITIMVIKYDLSPTNGNKV